MLQPGQTRYIGLSHGELVRVIENWTIDDRKLGAEPLRRIQNDMQFENERSSSWVGIRRCSRTRAPNGYPHPFEDYDNISSASGGGGSTG